MLRMKSIHKRFPGVHALKGVDFDLNSGECVALLGENGAGKSTIIKVLGGAIQPEEGIIQIDGKERRFSEPLESLEAGIAIIYQEFNLVPSLSAAENIFLGIEPSDFGWVREAEQNRRAIETFQRIGAEIQPATSCEKLTVAQKQLVEISKALVRDAKILVMDEPSAALTEKEVNQLYRVVEDLKRKGIGIIYVSHRLEEVQRLADRAVVMRDGERVAELTRKTMSKGKIIELMVGRSMASEFPVHIRKVGKVRLRAKKLKCGQRVKGVSLEIRAGEILALTGLVGAGRTETARLLFGADSLEEGEVELDGRKLDLCNPRKAIRSGICLLSEDRKEQGLILGLSVQENFGLPNLDRFSRSGWVNHKGERESFHGFVDKLQIKISNSSQLASQLSGGNQQKIVLAKWLERNAEILIFDEPTRGIDVGAKFEIYQWINQLADQGKGILMISSELPEVLGMSDRILVMKDGKVVGDVQNGSGTTQEKLMEMAIGEKISIS